MNSNQKQAIHGSGEWRRVAAVLEASDAVFLVQLTRFIDPSPMVYVLSQSEVVNSVGCCEAHEAQMELDQKCRFDNFENLRRVMGVGLEYIEVIGAGPLMKSES
ncbi:unnamed protein product [Prunus armeniaca]